MVRHLQVIERLFRLFFGLAVFLLQQADQLVLLAFGFLDLIVGQFAILRAQLAFEFRPVAFDLVPVQLALLCHGVLPRQRTPRASSSKQSHRKTNQCASPSGARAIAGSDGPSLMLRPPLCIVRDCFEHAV